LAFSFIKNNGSGVTLAFPGVWSALGISLFLALGF
jgi:hypothetical protein